MTRDEVIDECIAAVNRGCNYCDCLSEVEALKSKPLEKSPEVESREVDALRLQVGELKLALQGAQAEVEQLRWEARGSLMPGETTRSE